MLEEIRRVAGVRYEYEGFVAGRGADGKERAGRPVAGKLSGLPEKDRADLERALRHGDIQAMRKTVDSIAEKDPSAADLLRSRVEAYDYDGLRRILNQMTETE